MIFFGVLLQENTLNNTLIIYLHISIFLRRLCLLPAFYFAFPLCAVDHQHRIVAADLQNKSAEVSGIKRGFTVTKTQDCSYG